MFEIRLSGPGKNALGTPLMQRLLDRIVEADGRPILLTGDGDAFSAGLDLKEVASLDPTGMEAFLRLFGTLAATLYTYSGPTVALVNGHAIAGGCILAACCDYRVAKSDPKIRIGLNEVALGIRFPPALLAILRMRLPPAHFETIILGAELHAPQAALALGLVDVVEEKAREVAEARLAALAAHPAVAYAGAKVDLRGRAALVGGDPEAERRFIADVLPTWTSDDLKARLRKVLAR